jgi:hypothetical protein
MLRGTAAAVALLVLAASGSARASQDSVIPVPIGAGPEYQPAPRWPLAGSARFGGIGGGVQSRLRVHVELFADRRVVVVPGGIGVSGGRTTLYGFITDALWHAPAWTLEPGGVIHLARSGIRLGELFAIWGQPLGSDRLLSFRGAVHVYVNGEEEHADAARIVLRDHDEIVLRVGDYLPPHTSFTFRPIPPSPAQG